MKNIFSANQGFLDHSGAKVDSANAQAAPQKTVAAAWAKQKYLFWQNLK